MKKLGKLSINPEKIIKEEELFTLKGGYDWAKLICNGDGSNCYLDVAWCGNAQEDLIACNIGCPGTTIAICFP
jgi:hypothetical protein